jgi:hypothetical protein
VSPENENPILGAQALRDELDSLNARSARLIAQAEKNTAEAGRIGGMIAALERRLAQTLSDQAKRDGGKI